jgi:hypothetical protein
MELGTWRMGFDGRDGTRTSICADLVMKHRGPMLKAEGEQGNGILWFRKGTSAADAAHITSTAPRIPILAREEVLRIGRSLTPHSHAGGASGIEKALKHIWSACAAESPIRSVLGVPEPSSRSHIRFCRIMMLVRSLGPGW